MILVVGGAGYIGSHMVRLLRESNEPHLVLDNLENGHRAAVGDSPLVQGDLRDPASLARVFADNPRIDTVIHMAAYIAVGESEREPGKYWTNNVAGVLNLLEAMRTAGVSKLVFSSTAAVFGEPQYTPIDEAHPKAPTSVYGDTKLAVERMLDGYDRAHGLKSVCLRYFNACGASPDASIGEDHFPEEHLVPLAIYAAMGRRAALKVFGTDWPTPDGTCVRDYVHVLDLASAHLLAIKHLRQGGESRKYNLGNGKGFSVREVLDSVGRVAGKPVPADDAPRRPGDPAVLIASSAAIRDAWGWTPKYNDLDEIVRHAWAWHDSHPNGYGDRAAS
ncbi:UDP-glucose 4-epimerase GalE, partial [bacterium]